MKTFTLILITILFFGSCKKEEDIAKESNCSTNATVRDLTGLDGCGFVFELEDRTRLEPVRFLYCGTPPLPKEVTEDPLYNFVFEEGKKIKIGYEGTASPSICMIGPVVKITCLEEIKTTKAE